MSVLGDLLFYRSNQGTLDDALRHQDIRLQDEVNNLQDTLFSKKNDEEIAEILFDKVVVNPLSLNLEAAKATVREVRVDVSDPFGRGNVVVQGLEATKTIPFTGDLELWHLRPNSWDMNPPRGEIRGNTLVIGQSVPIERGDEAAGYIEETIARISLYLEAQTKQIHQYNEGLPAKIGAHISQRRRSLNAASELLKKLGG